MALARFEFAHGNAAEAKAVLEVMRGGREAVDDRADTSLMYAAALIDLGRNEEGLKILDRGDIVDLRQAQLWRSVAEASLGRLSRSREAYRKGEPALNTMPADLQILFRETAARVAIDARDYSTAAIELDAIDALTPQEGAFRRSLMRARIADGLGQAGLALESYRAIQSGDDAIAAAEARYRSAKLRIDRGEVTQADAIHELELMSVSWRGDVIEAEVLATLGELYTAANRWRDAFGVMRTAINVHPDAEITRSLQQTMSDRFADIFLGDANRIDTLDALALFLDFKELTPPGRRGDEIIRRLADRMVDVDLLTEAADLLEYQINNRLAGAARAQVGARAAVVHLLNQKPARAYRILQSTRLAGLPAELRRSRTLLEAKALAEIGRGDVAVELVDSLDGNDALLMKADILWQSRKWQEAGEALELLIGTRWRDNAPLSDEERMEVLRSGIAYAMSEDSLGLERLRVKFAALMSNSPDGRAFDTITAPIDARGAAFTEVARAIAATDTFTGFLDEYRKRHPDEAGPRKASPPAAPAPAPEALAPEAPAQGQPEQTAARS
jgi:tetratricopeptide (TPR) repeat protein